MIVLAITAIAAITILLGLGMLYFTQQGAVDQQKEVSLQNQNERIKEELEVTFSTDGEINVKNRAAEDTMITGIMVKCDDGQILTKDFEIPISSSGGSANFTTSLWESMIAQC